MRLQACLVVCAVVLVACAAQWTKVQVRNDMPTAAGCEPAVGFEMVHSDETLSVRPVRQRPYEGLQPDPRYLLELVKVGVEDGRDIYRRCRPGERCPEEDDSRAWLEPKTGAACVVFGTEFVDGCFSGQEVCHTAQ